MDNQLEDSACSIDDSDDLDDVPLAVAQNGRYELQEPPPTSREPPTGFSRPGFGFHLNLPTPTAEESESPRVPLQAMRSEPVYLPETSRARQPPGLALALGQGRGHTSFTGIPGDTSETLLTRRGPLKPPMLCLINPASASPVPSGAPTPAVHATGETPSCLRNIAWPPVAPGRRTGPVRVELISSAFVLQNPAHNPAATPSQNLERRRAASEDGGVGDVDADALAAAAAAEALTPASTSARIVAQCSSQLGIAASDLQFFELRPLEGRVIPESCSHVGVMIRGSTFSLSAVEDMLARIKRDEQLTTLLEGALRDSSQHAAEAKQQAAQLAKQNEELVVLRERLQAAEAANQQLREQLQRSDEHRQLLGSTIRTIKKEFEDFKSRVVVDGSLTDHLPLHQLSLGGPAQGGPLQAGGPAVPSVAVAGGFGASGLGGGGAAAAAAAATAAVAGLGGSGSGSGGGFGGAGGQGATVRDTATARR